MSASSLPQAKNAEAALLLAGLPTATAQACIRAARSVDLAGHAFKAIEDGVEAALSGTYAACVFAPSKTAEFAQVALLRTAGYLRPLIGLFDKSVFAADIFNLVLPPDTAAQTLIVRVDALVAQTNARGEAATQAEFQLSPLFAQLRHSFLLGLADAIHDMQTALQRGDWAHARHLAHTLKGSAASFDFAPLAQAAKELERLLRDDDSARAQTGFEQLRRYAASLGS